VNAGRSILALRSMAGLVDVPQNPAMWVLTHGRLPAW
jgi:hypothetical protein